MSSMVEDLTAVFQFAEERPDWGQGFIDGLEQAAEIMHRCMTEEQDPDKGMLVLGNVLAVVKEHLP